MEPRIWLIAGPTASGKSALALRLAREIGGEIVNADALQLYADLRTLSARPSPEEEAQAPHHLFGTVDGAEGWSVGRWLRAGSELIEAINGRGRPAILVGGTGLYFKALTQGLAEVPPVPAAVREAEEARFEAEGEAAARDRLRMADPAAEARIAPGDRLRLTRALEVLAATGKPLSDWQAETQGLLAPGDWRGLALEPPREAVYARCDARLAGMLQAGALDEVRKLTARALDPRLPVMKAVGVREFASHLAGEMPLDKALDDARRETRRYAKRQLTWLRNQMANWSRINAVEPEAQWLQLEQTCANP
ncbi:tRNA (adenosine(37)-N6)-dimethylallyltransferase MiaA [Caulobacter sp. SLTY]|uniref:tRNA (adenosine(37)-N6)-dimethylallyltransferase MiaA n=1 Tax=Caulobacter sp. SLTY TaxID=2683262 RepID=UPI001412E5F5|nr:tRNA (adenosine(37)-N6)-dimethylallyltransferase MiaA [Caulobacter sp. SLTY]NBB16154.1 tRNA (adenosine(37)-N6)-dimethylallyltransferase MiaA [Caulobacter sp. SLTY]